MVFKRRTLFIVGAGASAEFDLPVGSDLTEQIAAAAKFNLGNFNTPQDAQTSTMLDILRSRSQDPAQLNRWIKALRQISRSIFLKRSIDSYIDQHSDDPSIAEVGKLLIAMRILDAERRSSMPMIDDFVDLRSKKNRSSWLDQFAAMLFAELNVEALDSIGDNIDIVCFNYDRCIEHYLRHALEITYSIPRSHAARLVSKIRIIHPYGSLGSLDEVPFGDERRNYWTISENLKTFSESADTLVERNIEEAVRNAEQYVFLGFSFGAQNMKLLTLPLITENVSAGRYAYASAFGIHERARHILTDQIENMYGHDADPQGDNGADTYIEFEVKARALLDMHWHNIMAD